MKDRVINIELPDSWNKLNFNQLRFICRAIGKGLNPLFLRQLAFIRFANLKALRHSYVDQDGLRYYLWLQRNTKQFFWLSVQSYTLFLRQLDFMGKESKLSNQLLPVVRILGRKYYGPARKLFNLTYNEFIHSELCFNRYLDSKNIKDLNTLCAVLYRQSNGISPHSDNYQGDQRKPFNDFLYIRQAKRWRLVPLWKRIAIFLYYSGSREELYQAHSNLRQSSSVGQTQKSDMDQHRALINTLNQGDITKNKQVLQSLVWDVMAMLDRMIEQQNQLKKSAKK